MTERTNMLASIQRSVTLQCEVTVTVRAWGLLTVEANMADFFAFLRLFLSGVKGLDAATPEERDAQYARSLGLLRRVVQASLVKPEDAELLTVADLPVIANAIFELNRLGDVAGGLLGLLGVWQQAVVSARESAAGTSPSPNSSPS